MAGQFRSPRRLFPGAVAAVLLVVFAIGCTRESVPATDIGSFGLEGGPTDVLAGLDFRSATHAPSFDNYAPAETFGVDDAIALFGAAAVCQSTEGDCVVRPNAQMWIEKVAASTAGGVCEGMALLTIDRFLAGLGTETPQLTLNGEVNDRVVRLFATQFIPSVQKVARESSKLSLAESVLHIIEGLSAGGVPVTIGIYSDEGGHSLLPYGVEKTDDNRYAVWVYDPNWPLQERVLEIDTSMGSWRYAFDTENQNTDPNPWIGTSRELDIVDLSARQAPFTEAFEGAGPGRTLLTVTTKSRNWTLARGDTVIADDASGMGDAGIMHVTRGAFGNHTVVVEVPDSTDEISLEADDALDLSLERPGRAVRLASTGRTAVGMTLSDTTTMTVREGDTVARIADDNGVVDAAPVAGGALTVAEGEVSIVESADAEPVVIDRSSEVRQDVKVANGATEEVAPPVVDKKVVEDNDVSDEPAPVLTVPSTSIASSSPKKTTTTEAGDGIEDSTTSTSSPKKAATTTSSPKKTTTTSSPKRTTTTSSPKRTTTTSSPKKTTTTTDPDDEETTTTVRGNQSTSSSSTSTTAPVSQSLRLDGVVKSVDWVDPGDSIEFSTVRTDSADEAYVWIDGEKVEPKAKLEDGYFVLEVKFAKKDIGSHTVVMKLVRSGSVVRTTNTVTVTVTGDD